MSREGERTSLFFSSEEEKEGGKRRRDAIYRNRIDREYNVTVRSKIGTGERAWSNWLDGRSSCVAQSNSCCTIRLPNSFLNKRRIRRVEFILIVIKLHQFRTIWVLNCNLWLNTHRVLANGSRHMRRSMSRDAERLRCHRRVGGSRTVVHLC